MIAMEHTTMFFGGPFFLPIGLLAHIKTLGYHINLYICERYGELKIVTHNNARHHGPP